MDLPPCTYMAERKAFRQNPLISSRRCSFAWPSMEIEMAGRHAPFCGRRPGSWTPARHDATKFCAMAKRFVTETVSFEGGQWQCLQLHGGYGYLADYGIREAGA